MKEKIKIIAYITRVRANQREILVFKHKDFEEAGIQVIGGTVDNSENREDALIREIAEESGINFNKFDIKKILGTSLYQRKDRPELNFRHYFQIDGDLLLDAWDFKVQSNGEDNGLIFNFYWLSLSEAREVLTGNFAELFGEIT